MVGRATQLMSSLILSTSGSAYSTHFHIFLGVRLILSCSYVTIVFMQYGGLLSARNRRVSILHSNPLWGPRRNYAVPLGMIATALIAVVNLYGPGLNRVFNTTPIPGMFWGLPFAFAMGILCVDETRKLIVRTYPKVIEHVQFPHAYDVLTLLLPLVYYRENGLVNIRQCSSNLVEFEHVCKPDGRFELTIV